MDLITELTIFVLAAFVGFEVISKVPATLHTPLMSQTNAIHGIVMLGGLIVAGFADDALEHIDRLHRDRLRRDQHRRRLHGHRPDARHVHAARRSKPDAARPAAPATGTAAETVSPLAVLEPGGDLATLLYIVAFSLFIFGIRQRHPPDHRQAGQPDRRRRHGDRGRHDAPARRDRQLGRDPRRPRSSAPRSA